jgi:predicted GNAT superfamily acetyltransferase
MSSDAPHIDKDFPDARALGFVGDEAHGWTRTIRGHKVQFRLLRTLDALVDAERLQEEVFGVSERDLIPANELIVVAETGGAVLGAFFPQSVEAVGIIVGWGGFVGRPRMVSDFLAVRPEARNLGLAAELKRLQAAIALARGFEEIAWTVDPLRAANARLNFGKLGAVARGYEIDRYGASFAQRLYGGLPTDRLHVTWEITSPRVIARLLGNSPPELPAGTDIAPFESGTRHEAAAVEIPADVDELVATAPDEALAWRLRVRQALTQAFDEGFAVSGFLPAAANGNPSLLLEQWPDDHQKRHSRQGHPVRR